MIFVIFKKGKEMFVRQLSKVIGLSMMLALLPTQAADLRLHGSNTVGETLAPTLIEAWLTKEGYQDIQVREKAPQEHIISAKDDAGKTITVELEAHGSSTGFADLMARKTDVAMASRPVKGKEINKAKSIGLGDLGDLKQETVIALDGLAIIVHPTNPINQLSIEQIQGLFTGKTKSWNALGASGKVRLLTRDDKSGTYDTFKSLVLRGVPLAGNAERYESTNELAEKVANDPQAIGFVGLAGVGQSKAILVADGVAALPPSEAAVAVEDYPLARRLYLYASNKPSELAQSFLTFAISQEAQALVGRTGFVSQNINAYSTKVRGDMPDEYKELVDDAERLSVNFRFDSGDRLLQSKTMHDIQRLGEYLQRPENKGRYLRLIGFADESETTNYFSQVISNERADLIHALLLKEGVEASMVRGMGDAAPVANNNTQQGRAKNRRVEVWLGKTPLVAKLSNKMTTKQQ